MPGKQVNGSTGALLKAVEQLASPELEQFTADVLALCARRTGIVPAIPEAELIHHIRHAIPDELHRRSRELTAKRRAETLTPDEHAELLRVSDEMEDRNADRIWALGQLARLRGKSLQEVMQDLGIQPPPCE